MQDVLERPPGPSPVLGLVGVPSQPPFHKPLCGKAT